MQVDQKVLQASGGCWLKYNAFTRLMGPLPSVQERPDASGSDLTGHIANYDDPTMLKLLEDMRQGVSPRVCSDP